MRNNSPLEIPYSLLKLIDLTSQLRHSLVVDPLLSKILDLPGDVYTRGIIVLNIKKPVFKSLIHFQFGK